MVREKGYIELNEDDREELMKLLTEELPSTACKDRSFTK